MDQSKSSNGLEAGQFKQPKIVDVIDDSELYNDFEPLKIYLLKRIFSVGYDEYDGKVIIASSAKAARKLANLRYGGEGPIWDDANLVICKKITLDKPMIVLTSFKAG